MIIETRPLNIDFANHDTIVLKDVGMKSLDRDFGVGGKYEE